MSAGRRRGEDGDPARRRVAPRNTGRGAARRRALAAGRPAASLSAGAPQVPLRVSPPADARVGRMTHTLSPCGPHGDGELTDVHRHGVLRIVTDTDVRLWRRVHMDLVRYAGCVCRPSC
ncbi:putative leader peptide [Streptomyces sp. NPDC058291]|uniref:putative leader peptide n=1 Tax=Streptomyces sp. NPDC058291 TaxID=3346427 RepID=UPI0036E4D0A1